MTFFIGFMSGFSATILLELIILIFVVAYVDKNKKL